MNGGLIPNRYAKALYKFALQQGCAEQVYEEMKSVVSAFETNPDFSKVLANPFIDNKDKKQLLLSAAGSNIEDAYKGFVRLITDNRREMYAYEMALAYRDIYRKANNISMVKIITAAKMGKSEMEKLVGLVQKSFKGNTLEYAFSINPDIIGGFVINVDSVRMDASISNELEQLRLTLLNN
ncbi:MAG: ATP synthase F1 subunit delta [Prevotella sp.]|nr:ATP synthase F1 subunit delta [Prevotella sp.]MCM1074926.1 ATP synthase F1 subunit delta [Ruminococcus sp.]